MLFGRAVKVNFCLQSRARLSDTKGMNASSLDFPAIMPPVVDLDRFRQRVLRTDLVKQNGKVTQVIGLVIESSGPNAALGEICHIYYDRANHYDPDEAAHQSRSRRVPGKPRSAHAAWRDGRHQAGQRSGCHAPNAAGAGRRRAAWADARRAGTADGRRPAPRLEPLLPRQFARRPTPSRAPASRNPCPPAFALWMAA